MVDQDLTAALLKTPVIWDMLPCRLASISRIFEYHSAPDFRVKHCKMHCLTLMMTELRCGTLAKKGKGKGKGKAIPLQAWTRPEGSRRLRLPDGKIAHESGQVVSGLYPPGNILGSHFS
jgi:hypothetical protein